MNYGDFYRSFDPAPFYEERGWLIGDGRIGGKAKGLSFAHHILEKNGGRASAKIFLRHHHLGLRRIHGAEQPLGEADESARALGRARALQNMRGGQPAALARRADRKDTGPDRGPYLRAFLLDA